MFQTNDSRPKTVFLSTWNFLEFLFVSELCGQKPICLCLQKLRFLIYASYF